MSKVKFILLAAGISLALAFTFGCAGKTVKNAEATGNNRIANAPEVELENKLSPKQRESIPWGVGVGISTDRQMARTESIAQAQAAVARNAKLKVTGLLDGYAKNVNEEAKRITEDKVNNYVNTQIEGSYVLETIMEFNNDSKKYSIYTLVLLNPEKIKTGLSTISREELELRYDSQKMQERLEKMNEEYNNLAK
jgi:hypothetical protein